MEGSFIHVRENMTESKEPWPILPYEMDGPDPDQKVYTQFVDGKRFRVTTSHVLDNFHALALFAADNDNRGKGYDRPVFWSPGRRVGAQPIDVPFYYENWEGQMDRDDGHPFVQIDLPNQSTLNEYTFWFNTISKKGQFNGDHQQPPRQWFVVGRKEEGRWTLLDQRSAGESQWRNNTWGNQPALKNGSISTKVLNGGPYTSFRFVFTAWNGTDDNDILRLDRIRMDVTEGASTRPDGDGDDTDGEGTDEEPLEDPCVAEYGRKWANISATCRDKCEFGSKSKSELTPACRRHHSSWWLEENRMYLLIGAALLLGVVIYFVTNQ